MSRPKHTLGVSDLKMAGCEWRVKRSLAVSHQRFLFLVVQGL